MNPWMDQPESDPFEPVGDGWSELIPVEPRPARREDLDAALAEAERRGAEKGWAGGFAAGQKFANGANRVHPGQPYPSVPTNPYRKESE